MDAYEYFGSCNPEPWEELRRQEDDFYPTLYFELQHDTHRCYHISDLPGYDQLCDWTPALPSCPGAKCQYFVNALDAFTHAYCELPRCCQLALSDCYYHTVSTAEDALLAFYSCYEPQAHAYDDQSYHSYDSCDELDPPTYDSDDEGYAYHTTPEPVSPPQQRFSEACWELRQAIEAYMQLTGTTTLNSHTAAYVCAVDQADPYLEPSPSQCPYIEEFDEPPEPSHYLSTNTSYGDLVTMPYTPVYASPQYEDEDEHAFGYDSCSHSESCIDCAPSEALWTYEEDQHHVVCVTLPFESSDASAQCIVDGQEEPVLQPTTALPDSKPVSGADSTLALEIATAAPCTSEPTLTPSNSFNSLTDCDRVESSQDAQSVSAQSQPLPTHFSDTLSSERVTDSSAACDPLPSLTERLIIQSSDSVITVVPSADPVAASVGLQPHMHSEALADLQTTTSPPKMMTSSWCSHCAWRCDRGQDAFLQCSTVDYTCPLAVVPMLFPMCNNLSSYSLIALGQCSSSRCGRRLRMHMRRT